MISEIKMQNVASFKAPTSLTTDKKINLIYGLNGTGKSTISDFLLNPSNPRFSMCTINPEVTSAILVYNQTFIRENFYVTDKLKGVFSLSKENKAAEEKIVEAEKRLTKLQADLAEKNNNKAQDMYININSNRIERRCSATWILLYHPQQNHFI